jgi:hypothetical protein
VVEGVEHELADVGEDGGGACRDAVLGSGGEEFAENEVDVGGGHELAGEGGGEFGADTLGFQKLHFIVGVEETERGMGVVTEHATAAAVGSLELAAIGVRRRSLRDRFVVVVFVVVRGGCFLWHFHERSSV